MSEPPMRPARRPSSSNLLLVLAVLSLAVGGVLVGLVLAHDRDPNRFERRDVGGLDCVYDPAEDKIVACVHSTQLTRSPDETLPK